MSAGRISARSAGGLIRFAAAKGVDPERLWKLVGSSPAVLEDLDATVPVERVYDVWEAFYEQVKDPGLAMEVTRTGRRAPQDVLQFAVMTSPTLGQAIEVAVRFLRMRATSFLWELEPQAGGGLTLVQSRGGEDRVGRRLAIEATQSEMVAMSRALSGVDWAPVEVCFAHAALGATRAHQEFFRCPVRFQAERHTVAMEQAILERAMPKGEPALAAYFRQQAERALQRLEGSEPQDAASAVQRLVASNPREVPSLEDASRRLGMSGRTLRRRLEASGTTYQRLVDEARADIARRHLGQRSLTVAEIAYLVGFSEPSAFHRAFKRWTGKTPQEFRASSRCAPSVPRESSATAP